MGKRKGRKQIQETPIVPDELGDNREEVEEDVGGKGAGFFACYLLTSLCPRFKGHTYIGYTLNPRRRIRQHNGEIGCGAWRTKRKRPWEMVMCIYGFPTNIVALQFEWAWQHPVESLAVRKAAAGFKSLSGLANKIKLAYTMLTLPAWQRLNLTVNLFSTKYQKYTCACPALPPQMRTQICSMDDLPCYNLNGEDDNEFEEESRDDHDSPPSYNEENVHQEISSLGVEPSGRNSPESTPYRKDHNSPAKTLFSFSSYVYNSPPSYNEEYVHQEISSPGVEPSGRNLPESTPYRKEDHNSPAKTLFSFTSSSYVDELSREFDEAVDNRSATALVANKDQALMKSPDIRSREVEIIDLFTPSPCYAAVNSGCKKKRRPTPCPEITSLDVEPSGRNSPESTPYRKEGHNSPAKTLFPFTSSSSYVDELSREFDEAVDNRSATILVANEDQALMKSPDIKSREVEIIDLFTPSPCYAAVNSGCKKKRRPTLCPEIIDLTNSPLYV